MEEATQRAFKLLGEEKIDVLVNNGGISTRSFADEMRWSLDRDVMTVNYLGPVALTKAVLPAMMARRAGQIVVISSVQGLIALPARTAYSASKHALHGFFDGLRAEVSSRGIGVTVICPGYVKTSLSINAINAQGEKMGELDENAKKGMTTEAFVETIIAKDFDAHVAPFLRVLTPNILEFFMRKRAAKQLKISDKKA
ncbi:hypothetical protein GUITHDRAFT_139692 [Guillardia theta CCMP2712]|uniref:Short chain dehydrogenase n=1 Tax=Guillardia theta (strain CCMP2712) TaxID=905079 RepID=L1J7E6_GUITC|nr:hypothetical protein GUITHDRAFT_139692 [Guillardia theta CCMP2712]EKX44441.1 hypothetical protein GUITHDRAFT_139692 [Guillardia theta CCMP2712]|eukprot:XP_005831421.1 hypothetical protein GUITHDRAFT_139692 [Guillardia theta CCMP2712]